MEFRILGSLEVLVAGEPVALTSSKQQALLVAGLLNANRVISVVRLIDAIWGVDPPATAAGLVQSYVSALRRKLHRPHHPQVIITRPPGYVVLVSPGQLDQHQFEQLLARGVDAASRGDDNQAAQLLRTGLALWRGPALDGLNSPTLRAEAVRLDEMRWTALEERVAAEVRLGHLEPVAAELAGLVSAYPLRERLRAQLMRALYQLGRQADALEVYWQGRNVLRQELGLEPAAQLRGLYEAILAGDPALDPPTTLSTWTFWGLPRRIVCSHRSPDPPGSSVPGAPSPNRRRSHSGAGTADTCHWRSALSEPRIRLI